MVLPEEALLRLRAVMCAHGLLSLLDRLWPVPVRCILTTSSKYLAFSYLWPALVTRGPVRQAADLN